MFCLNRYSSVAAGQVPVPHRVLSPRFSPPLPSLFCAYHDIPSMNHHASITVRCHQSPTCCARSYLQKPASYNKPRRAKNFIIFIIKNVMHFNQFTLSGVIKSKCRKPGFIDCLTNTILFCPSMFKKSLHCRIARYCLVKFCTPLATYLQFKTLL